MGSLTLVLQSGNIVLENKWWTLKKLTRAIISGVVLGAIHLLAPYSHCEAANSEAKELATVRKQVLNGDTITARTAITAREAISTKMKGEWLELQAILVYYFGHGQYESEARMAAQLAPNNAHVLSTYAMTLFLRRKFTKALEASNKALALAPKDARTKGINTVCQVASGKLKMSKAELLNMAKNAGDNWDLYLILMQHFAFQSELNAKFEVLNLMVTNNPKSSFAYCRRAIDWRKHGDNDKAIRDSKEAVKLCPSNSEALFNLATVQHSLKKYADCVSTYDTLEKQGKLFPWGVNQRAKANFALKKFDKAAADCLLSIQQYTGETKPSKQALATKRLSGDSKSDTRRMFVMAAECFREMGKLDQAISYLRCASLVSPGEFDVLEVQAKVHRDQGKLDLALAELNEMVLKRPHLSTNFSERGQILKRLGKNAEAESDMKKAAEMEATVKKWHFKPLPGM